MSSVVQKPREIVENDPVEHNSNYQTLYENEIRLQKELGLNLGEQTLQAEVDLNTAHRQSTGNPHSTNASQISATGYASVQAAIDAIPSMAGVLTVDATVGAGVDSDYETVSAAIAAGARSVYVLRAKSVSVSNLTNTAAAGTCTATTTADHGYTVADVGKKFLLEDTTTDGSGRTLMGIFTISGVPSNTTLEFTIPTSGYSGGSTGTIKHVIEDDISFTGVESEALQIFGEYRFDCIIVPSSTSVINDTALKKKRIENIRFASDKSNDMISIGAGSEDITFFNCVFFGMREVDKFHTIPGTNCYFTNADRVKFLYCLFESRNLSASQRGSHLEAQSCDFFSVYFSDFYGCKLNSSGNACVWIEGCNNTFYAFNNMSIWEGSGISYRNSGVSHTCSFNNFDNSGNTFLSGNTRAMEINAGAQGATGIDKVNCIGNQVVGDGSYTIGLALDKADYINACNNNFLDISVWGILLQSNNGADFCNVIGNIVKGASGGTGLSLGNTSTAGGCDWNRVIGNFVTGFANGIVIGSGTTNNVVTNNSATGNTTNYTLGGGTNIFANNN